MRTAAHRPSVAAPAARRLLAQVLGLPLVLLLGSCANSDGIRRAKPLEPARVPTVLAEAEATLARGDAAPLGELERTVSRLRSARVTDGLPPELRTRVQNVLEQAADELVRRAERPKVLKDLIESELPMRFAARAGVRAAELQYEDGERIEAFKTIRALDTRYPTHTQRERAGELLAEVGMDLADDDGRYLFFFKYASLAPQVLEYLALQYPTHPETDDALARLAEIYEEDRLWNEAIVKHQELVLWAPASPFRSASEASIPRLRLASMKRPDYARDTLLQARNELMQWLVSHPTDEQRPEIERLLVDARQRLADNDLIVARFYLTVGSAAGVRLHALRADAEARLAGNTDQVREAQELLAQAVHVPSRVEVEPDGEGRPAPSEGPAVDDVLLEGARQ